MIAIHRTSCKLLDKTLNEDHVKWRVTLNKKQPSSR